VLSEAVTGWCLPIDQSFATSAGQDGAAPQGARVGAWMYDQFNLQIPATSCTLVIAFNQAAPAGMRLQYVNETNAPWLDLELTPASSNPTTAWAAMTQSGIINPPAWEVTYTVRVIGPDGSELFKQPVRFFKATPNPCWDGSLPDPVTLYCPNWDGDWNYRDFPNCNPNADIFQGNPPPGCGEGE
jgi:hypothetical protein